MDNLLKKIITTKDPNEIEKYVHKYLPKEKQKLQTIFNELNKYQLTINSPQKQKTKLQPKQTPKNSNFVRESPVQGSIKKSKSLIKSLQKKGVYLTEDILDLGMQVFEKSKQKFLTPLKSNPIIPFIQNPKINRLCEKYEINREFYQQTCPDSNASIMGYDPEMTEFILKRKQLLKSIEEKKIFKSKFEYSPKKFQHIKSRVRSKSTQDSPNNLAPLSSRISSASYLNTEYYRNETNSIMQECSSARKSTRTSTMETQSKLFENLTQKLKGEDEDEIQLQKMLQTNATESAAISKFERYDLENHFRYRQKRTIAKINSKTYNLLKFAQK